MSDKACPQTSLTARYDPDRNERGHFVKGNSASVAHSTEAAKALKRVRTLWWTTTSDQEWMRVKAELLGLCVQNDDLDVKLKALIYYIDRHMGKPTENLTLDVTQDGGRPLALPDLTAEEVQIIERVVRRTAGDDPQAIAG